MYLLCRLNDLTTFYIPIILGLYPHEIPIETVYMPHVPRPVGEAQHFRGPAKCPDGHDLTLQICGQQTQAGIDLYPGCHGGFHSHGGNPMAGRSIKWMKMEHPIKIQMDDL